ncbi:MAG: hypothetical protein ACOC8K_06645 [Gemmatimonadota bacterium]
MKRITALAAVLGSLALAACQPAQVVVTAEAEGTDPETGERVPRPLADMEVSLLPYDRDEVFDSLEAAFPDPEPAIPDSLIEAREDVAEAQTEWRQAEARWNTLRDTLQTLSAELEQYNPAEDRYRELFNIFSDLEGELAGVEEEMNEAFERFDSLQQGIIAQSEDVEASRADWADQAFADAAAVIEARIDDAGVEPRVDTTDASGTITFSAPPGEWWVYTRTELPYSELYWNVPVTVEGGETTEVRLSEENAEERPNL